MALGSKKWGTKLDKFFNGIPRREFRLLKYFDANYVHDTATGHTISVDTKKVQEVVDIS